MMFDLMNYVWSSLSAYMRAGKSLSSDIQMPIIDMLIARLVKAHIHKETLNFAARMSCQGCCDSFKINSFLHYIEIHVLFTIRVVHSMRGQNMLK